MTAESASTTLGTTTKTAEGAPVNGAAQVITLVIGAGKGDQQAWNALVERHSSLVWSICRRYRLSQADAEDVFQTVWMRLVEQLDRLDHPAALCGWLSTTTRRECSRVRRANCRHAAAEQVCDFEGIPDQLTETGDHELLMAERNATLREAFTRLPSSCQRLLALPIADPPMPYTEISSKLGIPIGSIGPRPRPSARNSLPGSAGSARPEKLAPKTIDDGPGLAPCRGGQKVHCTTCSQDAVFPG